MFKRAGFVPIALLGFVTLVGASPKVSSPTLVQPEIELTPLVMVPAGSYVRCVGCVRDEIRHTITLSAYQIESDEVTNRQYDQCVKQGACKKAKYGGTATWPVRGVSWYDAEAYCKWAGRRLPTSAEWEKAAFPTFPGQDGRGPRVSSRADLCNILNIAGYPKYPTTTDPKRTCADPSNTPWTVARIDLPIIGNDMDVTVIGDKQIWDLFGNVAEWVSDWSDGGKTYFHPPIMQDPQGPPVDVIEQKMIRGGSFSSKDGIDQSHWRAEDPKDRFKDVGFRCAADAKPANAQK